MTATISTQVWHITCLWCPFKQMFRYLRPQLTWALARAQSTAAFQNENCQRVASVLDAHGFTEKQSNKLVNILSGLLHKDSYKQIEASLNCWTSVVRPKSTDYHENVRILRETFVNKEARLLLMEPDAIVERNEQLKSINLIRGQKDLWILVTTSPAGYYLQDWAEILRKHYYINFKILPWLELTDDSGLHPLVRSPRVIELPFNEIKTRFLFTQRAGFKELYSQYFSKVNLTTLLYIPVDEFLRLHAPHCTYEEYKALEKLNTTELGEEDDQIFEQLIQLAPKAATGKSMESYLKANLVENYVISVPK